MSRRNAAIVREVLPDPVYNRTDITKLINQVMEDGKRTIAQKIVYEALENKKILDLLVLKAITYQNRCTIAVFLHLLLLYFQELTCKLKTKL